MAIQLRLKEARDVEKKVRSKAFTTAVETTIAVLQDRPSIRTLPMRVHSFAGAC